MEEKGVNFYKEGNITKYKLWDTSGEDLPNCLIYIAISKRAMVV